MFFAFICSVLFEKRLYVNQSTTTSSAILTQENFSFVSPLQQFVTKYVIPINFGYDCHMQHFKTCKWVVGLNYTKQFMPQACRKLVSFDKVVSCKSALLQTPPQHGLSLTQFSKMDTDTTSQTGYISKMDTLLPFYKADSYNISICTIDSSLKDTSPLHVYLSFVCHEIVSNYSVLKSFLISNSLSSHVICSENRKVSKMTGKCQNCKFLKHVTSMC